MGDERGRKLVDAFFAQNANSGETGGVLSNDRRLFEAMEMTSKSAQKQAKGQYKKIAQDEEGDVKTYLKKKHDNRPATELTITNYADQDWYEKEYKPENAMHIGLYQLRDKKTNKIKKESAGSHYKTLFGGTPF